MGVGGHLVTIWGLGHHGAPRSGCKATTDGTRKGRTRLRFDAKVAHSGRSITLFHAADEDAQFFEMVGGRGVLQTAMHSITRMLAEPCWTSAHQEDRALLQKMQVVHAC